MSTAQQFSFEKRKTSNINTYKDELKDSYKFYDERTLDCREPPMGDNSQCIHSRSTKLRCTLPCIHGLP